MIIGNLQDSFFSGIINYGGMEKVPTELTEIKENKVIPNKDTIQLTKEALEAMKKAPQAQLSSACNGLGSFLEAINARKNGDITGNSAPSNIDKMGTDELNEYLYNNCNSQKDVYLNTLMDYGFFDHMSEDKAKEVYELIGKITNGMSRLGQMPIDEFDLRDNMFINRNEAEIELISSTAALKQFSDRFLTGDAKAAFDKVTNSYTKFNAETVSTYQSPQDVRRRALAASDPYNTRVATRVGRVEHTTEETEEYNKIVVNIFGKLEKDGSDFSSLLGELKKNFISFYTKDSKYPPLVDFVEAETAKTFKNMESYWSDLNSFQLN